MSSTGTNTCKFKGLYAEFNANCKKRAAKANIGTAAGQFKRGGHAKVYHSSPRALPRGRSVARACARRSAGEGHGTRPLRRPEGRHALGHSQQVSQGPVAMARNLAHEPGAN